LKDPSKKLKPCPKCNSENTIISMFQIHSDQNVDLESLPNMYPITVKFLYLCNGCHDTFDGWGVVSKSYVVEGIELTNKLEAQS